jgi:hypothetical protein
MIKYSRKVGLPVLAALLALILIAVFNFGTVVYWQDPANECLWERGEINLTTGVNNHGDYPTKRIPRFMQNQFISQAAAKHECWYRQ